MAREHLTVNIAHVVHETIDGETILIHLGSGAYYSLAGCGAQVWEMLVAGAGADEVIASTQIRYDADPAEIAQPISALIDELLAEELIVEDGTDSALRIGSDGKTSTPLAQAGDATIAESATRQSFVAPVLHKYTDMQEFMLVDPLHDVEQEVGWPRLKDA